MKIGIVGFGFVGKAVYEGFKDAIGEENILINDIADANTIKSLYGVNVREMVDLANNCDFIFVCVPTPTDIETGEINTRNVGEVVESIYWSSKSIVKKPVVIIKSTVIPGTCRGIQNQNLEIPIVFNPEFLTEVNYIEDFKNQEYVVLGGQEQNSSILKKVGELYWELNSHMKIYKCIWEEAEMTKYMMNCFLASKVALFNEFYRICKASNIDYDQVSKLAGFDKRIGWSHTDVPGDDGNFGFGGKCLPKDLLALINFAESRQVDAKILKQIWESNLEVRSDRNWLNISGAIE